MLHCMAVILVSLPIASTDRLWRSRTLKFERNWCDLLQVNAEGFAREGRLSGIRGWERTNSIIPLYHTFSLRETVVGICNAIAPTHRLKDPEDRSSRDLFCSDQCTELWLGRESMHGERLAKRMVLGEGDENCEGGDRGDVQRKVMGLDQGMELEGKMKIERAMRE
jgi:hypothetical protein